MNLGIRTAVLVSNQEEIQKTVASFFLEEETLLFVTNKEEAELIGLESPELVIVDFSDWELGFAVLDSILSDPWLHHQSIITLCSAFEVEHRLESHKAINLIAAIPRVDLEYQLPLVLAVVRGNGRLLFRRALVLDLGAGVSGVTHLHNDPVEIECCVNMVCSYLYNSNRLGQGGRNRLRIALTEMLVNAVEHGNCNITFDEKRAWLEAGHTIIDLLDTKLQDPLIAQRSVKFEYVIDDTFSSFVITDEGDGFDWPLYFAAEQDMLNNASGRGILIAQGALRELAYNKKGNQVTCVIAHQEISSNEVPAIFRNLIPLDLATGDELIREGAKSDYLYFIIKGELAISFEGKRLSVLTPDDIFVGEMSFLLHSNRTASVVALCPSRVVPISRTEFVHMIKEYPHYSLFLSRLLAQRVIRHNYEAVGLESINL